MADNDILQGKSDAFAAALDAVAGIGAAGFVLVPAIPLLSMLQAGAAAGKIPTVTVEKIWQAMLASAALEWGDGINDPERLLAMLATSREL